MLLINKQNTLGRGGFGVIFTGVWNKNSVAVKEIDLNRSHKVKDLFQLIKKEIEIQKSLNHINIVKLFDSCMKNNHLLHLVMELMDKGDLFTLLFTQEHVLDSSIQLSITKDVVAGLHYLHEQGILHRDIKPENILLNQQMQAKIADFGFATYAHDAETDRILGTPSYQAPEIALAFVNRMNRYEYTRFTDVYALGITLLKMVRRDYAYPLEHQNLPWYCMVQGRCCAIPKETHQVLADIILSCLIKNPEYRIDSQGIACLLPILLCEPDLIQPVALSGKSHVVHFAAKNGRLDLLKKLIQQHPEFLNLEDESGRTALNHAEAMGHDQMVDFLRVQGLDMDIVTSLAANLEIDDDEASVASTNTSKSVSIDNRHGLFHHSESGDQVMESSWRSFVTNMFRAGL